SCPKWAAKIDDSSICVNPTMKATDKANICAVTCAFEIKPTSDCALYTVTGTTLKRGTPSNRTTGNGTPVASGAVDPTTLLSRAFAAPGCTVSLYSVAAPVPPANRVATFTGTTTNQFFTVPAAVNGAPSYTCTC
ncbi:hypothetical protein PFISCL1PPCAC_25708, partial [Pristionchus fissidentatus]